MAKITKDTVRQISKLAAIPITKKEEEELAEGFNKTLEVVENLFKVDVVGVEPTHQVTGLKNVFREDEVNQEKMLTQDEALKNARKKYNGYFVVDQILAED